MKFSPIKPPLDFSGPISVANSRRFDGKLQSKRAWSC